MHKKIFVLRTIESIAIVEQHLLLEFHRNRVPAHKTHSSPHQTSCKAIVHSFFFSFWVNFFRITSLVFTNPNISLPIVKQNFDNKVTFDWFIFRLSMPVKRKKKKTKKTIHEKKQEKKI